MFTLGFALETGNAVENGRRKLDKGVDLIAVNEVGPDTGFGAPTNQVTLVGSNGEAEEWPLLPKEDVAERLLDRIETGFSKTSD